MIHARKRNQLSRFSLAGLPVLFLFLYMAGSVEVDSFHNLVHPDDYFVLHSPAQEKDTCHLSIYHPGLNQGCEHKSHLIESKKCSLCQYATHTLHLFTVSPVRLAALQNDPTSDHYNNLQVDPIFLHLSSRAPPFA
ncbi:MAG TPA: hypothetical protein VFW11_02145 [Cyclobacteriaceae bacterium]|nr:hypothetical protein [Cyclobacteriaceae bacterium]